jgi:hypothetical protein
MDWLLLGLDLKSVVKELAFIAKMDFEFAEVIIE